MGNLNSSKRKQSLSGWLLVNRPREFASNLKLQKFLFFYELLSKIDEDEYELRNLKGYKNGPVFSDVWGDFIYETSEFVDEIKGTYYESMAAINTNRAKLSSFLVSIMTDKELSKFTHVFNIWKAKEQLINRGIKNIPLNESDFNQEDVDVLLSLKEMYTDDYISSVAVFSVGEKIFIINNDDLPRLTEDTKSVFLSLAERPELLNPVYVEISEEGVVLVD